MFDCTDLARVLLTGSPHGALGRFHFFARFAVRDAHDK
jgi:hypothetical protein